MELMHLVSLTAAGFTLVDARICRTSKCSGPTVYLGHTGPAAARPASKRVKTLDDSMLRGVLTSSGMRWFEVQVDFGRNKDGSFSTGKR